jgi:hypothetical protein
MARGSRFGSEKKAAEEDVVAVRRHEDDDGEESGREQLEHPGRTYPGTAPIATRTRPSAGTRAMRGSGREGRARDRFLGAGSAVLRLAGSW